MTVVILEDAAEDIEAGRNFYESREAGIGEYSFPNPWAAKREQITLDDPRCGPTSSKHSTNSSVLIRRKPDGTTITLCTLTVRSSGLI